jgi:hypothetical protein
MRPAHDYLLVQRVEKKRPAPHRSLYSFPVPLRLSAVPALSLVSMTKGAVLYYTFNYIFLCLNYIKGNNSCQINNLAGFSHSAIRTAQGREVLHFLRNKEKQEVDFLLVRDNEPLLLIEAKFADAEPAKSLRKFQDALNVPAIQLINQGDTYKIVSKRNNKILVAPACQWLAHLP